MRFLSLSQSTNLTSFLEERSFLIFSLISPSPFATSFLFLKFDKKRRLGIRHHNNILVNIKEASSTVPTNSYLPVAGEIDK